MKWQRIKKKNVIEIDRCIASLLANFSMSLWTTNLSRCFVRHTKQSTNEFDFDSSHPKTKIKHTREWEREINRSNFVFLTLLPSFFCSWFSCLREDKNTERNNSSVSSRCVTRRVICQEWFCLKSIFRWSSSWSKSVLSINVVLIIDSHLYINNHFWINRLRLGTGEAKEKKNAKRWRIY